MCGWLYVCKTATKEFLKRRDETFRRIPCSALAELFEEYEDSGSGSSASQPEMVARMVEKRDGQLVLERVPVEDNQSAGANGPRIVSYDAEEQEAYDPPYLILDTRSKDEFAVNRIHRAKSFPAAFLCRDVLLPEMHRFVRLKRLCLRAWIDPLLTSLDYACG